MAKSAESLQSHLFRCPQVSAYLLEKPDYQRWPSSLEFVQKRQEHILHEESRVVEARLCLPSRSTHRFVFAGSAHSCERCCRHSRHSPLLCRRPESQSAV